MTERLKQVQSEINPAKLDHPTLAFLRDYWEQKRGTRAMPSRADIKPSELREHLSWVIVMEVLPGMADFRYKLIGTLVSQYWLRDSTGKTVSEAFSEESPGAAKGVLAMFRKCARDKAIVRSWGSAGWIEGGFEDFDCIVLPLSDDGENVNQILHAFVFDRPDVLMAREIARSNGGRLLERPKAAS
ncbi:MAG TPA: PAS domain-containing protein [Rhizomicrobium sp.]|jgi:hypothetical protein